MIPSVQANRFSTGISFSYLLVFHNLTDPSNQYDQYLVNLKSPGIKAKTYILKMILRIVSENRPKTLHP
jgi:hypothetical protein